MSKCENCGKSRKTLTLVHIKTGKRGRPPKKNYCDDCLTSEAGTFYLPGEAKQVREAARSNPDAPQPESSQAATARAIGFAPSCLFLLKMQAENLFEPHGTGEFEFRCKGCDGIVHRTEREKHYREHRTMLAA